MTVEVRGLDTRWTSAVPMTFDALPIELWMDATRFAVIVPVPDGSDEAPLMPGDTYSVPAVIASVDDSHTRTIAPEGAP